jgi:dolichyl-phosphate beta-glucosyltransferase
MVIVIPCYNEFNRLNKKEVTNFLQANPEVKIIFSDDASTDRTLQLLQEIQLNFSSQVYIYKSPVNQGKAEAVRQAVLYAFQQQISITKIGYIDADLSVSLEECLALSTKVNDKILFVFGSRIAKIDNTIIRSDFRHYTGRFVATIISKLLQITVYDTQCGCKIFDAKLASIIFQEAFISKWLFDVELFFRIINLYTASKLKDIAREIPLQSWIEKGDSAVKLTYAIKMWQDLYLIYKRYGKSV